ncbi:MAG TPA: ABC transporter permease [Chitinophagales bacterium]|nr:ABC transporter permease [Chitinophagales bacterium]
MTLLENIKLALRAIRSNLVRTILTFLIIAFGIMALVGILTAIDSLKSKLNSSFTFMGANTFTISRKWTQIQGEGGDNNWKPSAPIIYTQAMEFKRRFEFPSLISIGMMFNRGQTVEHGSKKTNPNVSVYAVDENFLSAKGFEIARGRYFTPREINLGIPVIILGPDVVLKIFTDKEDPINQVVSVKGNRYRVVGILKSKGSSMMLSDNRTFLLPLMNAKRNYIGPDYSWQIGVTVSKVEQLDPGVDEAKGIMRNIRRLRLGADDDFEIEKSDELANTLFSQLKYIRYGAVVIGIITLFGAAIGLMNIMLVSVTERTMEIGVSKALGATKKMIRRQFLAEAIVICILGGLLGIVLGILIGNVVSIIVGGSFIIPWIWIVAGIIFCYIVGLISGLYPAIKASNLDPIEALRYE